MQFKKFRISPSSQVTTILIGPFFALKFKMAGRPEEAIPTMPSLKRANLDRLRDLVKDYINKVRIRRKTTALDRFDSN